MRVADLFCGAGGISEGFRLAGFEIAYALDKERAAVETFKANHPDATVVHGDASNLTAADIGPVDIIVGGPPCVNFSSSKGGRANPLEGLRLVQAFLRVVYEAKPKYWVMENVPRIVLHLPAQIPLRWIGVDQDGYLPVPTRAEFTTTDFGVAQARKRYLMGNFPIPTADWTFDRIVSGKSDVVATLAKERTLGHIVSALPPFETPPQPGTVVRDPVYGIVLPAEMLTDHFHDVVMSPDEVRRIREAKCEHPYMGRMAFPDDLTRPARTVVATQLGRETLVLAAPGGRFRRATVRECASLQSFPITYQFHGAGLSARYRLVGDAVPPLLSFAVAAEIVRQETGTYPAPVLRTGVGRLAPAARTDFRRARKKQVFPPTRRFTALVPGKEVRGCRAEFDNQGGALTTDGVLGFVPKWQARLYTGEGKATLRVYPVALEQALAELAIASDLRPLVTQDALLKFVDALHDEFRDRVPDASVLQARWSGRASGPGPDELVARMREVVDAHFPVARFAKTHLPSSHIVTDRRSRGLRLRIAAGLVAAAFVAERVNRPEHILDGLSSILRRAFACRREVKQPALF